MSKTAAVLARKLYSDAIALKAYNANRLRFRNWRGGAVEELRLIRCGCEELEEELRDDASYSQEYRELAEYMTGQANELMTELSASNGRDCSSVCRRLCGFHNLPRAFLPVGDNAKISAKEAVESYRTYLPR